MAWQLYSGQKQKRKLRPSRCQNYKSCCQKLMVMAMLNHIVIMGHLVRDPEPRYTQNGTAVASMTLAVDRNYTGRDDQDKQTDFIDVVAWRNTAEFIANHFTKGRMAIVSGRLQIRIWEDKEGNKRKAAEVVAASVYFGDSKKESASRSSSQVTQYNMDDLSQYGEFADENDEIPF